MFNVKVVCASCKDLEYVRTALAKGSFRTKRRLEENGDDENKYQPRGNKRSLVYV